MLNLGVIKKNGKIINHRSLLKVCLNPFLRLIGLQIATSYDAENEVLGKPILTRCPKRKLIWSWDYDLNDCEVEKRRRFL